MFVQYKLINRFQVAEAKITSQEIDVAREYYRPAAARASLLYFILNELNTINPIYQFSLKVTLTKLDFFCISRTHYFFHFRHLV